tara:strand:- start:984 stop:1568 length:585 start_codon:yes stop_codon:yes gene_type:complete
MKKVYIEQHMRNDEDKKEDTRNGKLNKSTVMYAVEPGECFEVEVNRLGTGIRYFAGGKKTCYWAYDSMRGKKIILNTVIFMHLLEVSTNPKFKEHKNPGFDTVRAFLYRREPRHLNGDIYIYNKAIILGFDALCWDEYRIAIKGIRTRLTEHKTAMELRAQLLGARKNIRAELGEMDRDIKRIELMYGIPSERQ